MAAAANLQGRGLASLGKRFLGQIGSGHSVASAFAPLSLRSVHDSIYAKNQDEQAGPVVVPDHVIPPQPEQYWAPHPETGVFGPASDDKSGSSVDGGVSEGSALHQTAFFRSLEDLDKPPVDLHKQEQA